LITKTDCKKDFIVLRDNLMSRQLYWPKHRVKRKNPMKMTKIVATLFACSTSLTPLIATPVFAVTASPSTSSSMASVCAMDLGANAAVVLHDGTPSFTTEVDVTSTLEGTPTEVPGTRVESPGSRFGTGTVTYSGTSIVGDPFRTGGSVNLFGDQVATQKNWSNSEYDFNADFATVTTYAYSCIVTQQTETYHPAVPPTPIQGYYVNCDFGNGQGNDNSGVCEDGSQPQGSCAAHNAQGSSFPRWGTDTEQCKFIKTADATLGSDAYWELDTPTARPDLTTLHTIDETNTASAMGHEVNGGPFTQIGNWLAGKVVVCNSPTRLPGVWRAQNGYSGAKCTTAYFNIAPWGGGSQTSNGTYISVPGT
jgi:hypothetical protein